MATQLTTRERFQRMFEHRTADRVPIVDGPWSATIERWQAEGLPKDVHWADYFGVDRMAHVGGDNSPALPEAVVEETGEYTIATTRWGQTVKNWKHANSTPGVLHSTITSPDVWRQMKARMVPHPDRINWKNLRDNYRAWREKGWWIEGGLWFGFDVTHARMVGTEEFLLAMVEQPEWCMDIFEHELTTSLALLDMIWDAGYTFDAVRWPDDMGYKQTQFFSLPMYRELLKPFHKRAIQWAHAKGIHACLHSCGNVYPFIPELVEIGLDCLNPLEVKAGMDPLHVKKTWGDKLVLHGGINAMLWHKPEQIEAEMRRVVPRMIADGGYIFSSDHSVPSSVSLEDFRRIIELARQLGAYE